MSFRTLFILGFIGVLLVAIPVTVYYLQQQQEIRSRAAKATILSLVPVTKTVNTNESFTLDINMDPGSNKVIGATLSITYDPTKLATDGAGLSLNPDVLPNTIGNVVYTSGNILVTAQTGIDIAKIISTQAKIATVAFKALNANPAPGTDVTFGTETSVFATTEDPETNVLSTANGAKVIINIGSSALPTPTPTPTQNSPLGTNQPPVCSALNIDRSPAGAAPFAISFTAIGTDPDGVINKATFNFGDGPVQDITTAGGIGTNSINVQASHSYQNPGTYSASVILTDNRNAVSALGNCTKTITVTGTATVATPTAQIIQISNPTPTPIPTIIAQPTTEPPGPGEMVLGVGVAGAALTIIGAIFFFAL